MPDQDTLREWLDERFSRQSDQLKSLDEKVEDRFNSLDKKVDHNRANADTKFISIENTLNNAMGAWGNWGPYNAFTPNKAKSWIFNRFYLEDLTVSGRSYATVDALDYGLWSTATASGGKLYGDTFVTNPTSLP